MRDRWDHDLGYRPAPPRQARNGIKARSRRGAIGETWWSGRFIEILESFNMGPRLSRGRSYARKGQVMDLELRPGAVTAKVQGTRVRPYRVTIEIACLSERDWRRAEDVMASQAIFLAKLLAGEMPAEIEEAFSAAKLSLFPATRNELKTSCTCPDYASPCKHVAATYYILAERFDEDPFLILAWRGRPKDVLLANLRLLRADVAPPETGPDDEAEQFPTLEESLDHFWEVGKELSDLHVRPRAAGIPEGILRQLDPLALAIRGKEVTELLAPAYRIMSTEAERRALGAT